MKIGIDARSLSRSLTGIGRYTLEMCKALARRSDVSLILYSPSFIDMASLGLKGLPLRSKNWTVSVMRQWWSQTELPRQIAQDNLDVFWGPAHFLPFRLPQKLARVVTIHDLVWKYEPRTMRWQTYLLERYQMPFALRSADQIVTDSLATHEAVKAQFNIKSNNLNIVPLAAYKKIEKTASLELNLDFKQPYFLFVGTLEPRKNLIRLLQAYASLPCELRNKAFFVIVGGSGWGKLDLFNLLNALNLQAQVKWLGYVSEAVLSKLYENCLFLALPSLYEGFGLPIVEAMSYGKPVLAADNSSMPELVGVAGVLVNALSVHSIAEGLKSMIKNDSLRQHLGSCAKFNSARFNWDASAEKIMSAFNKAISDRAKQ